MDIAPIKTKRDYRRVLKEIEALMDARRNSPEGDRLDVLVTLVEAFERKHYPLDLPDPVEAIKYHMDQNGLQPRDLIPYIGSRNRVHEVLNRRRPLTLKMIWRLHQGLGIPAESLDQGCLASELREGRCFEEPILTARHGPRPFHPLLS